MVGCRIKNLTEALGRCHIGTYLPTTKYIDFITLLLTPTEVDMEQFNRDTFTSKHESYFIIHERVCFSILLKCSGSSAYGSERKDACEKRWTWIINVNITYTQHSEEKSASFTFRALSVAMIYRLIYSGVSSWFTFFPLMALRWINASKKLCFFVVFKHHSNWLVVRLFHSCFS